MVQVVGTLPSQDMLGTLGEYSLESHIGHQTSYLIVIDEAGVAEYLGFLAKELVDLVHLTLNLVAE